MRHDANWRGMMLLAGWLALATGCAEQVTVPAAAWLGINAEVGRYADGLPRPVEKHAATRPPATMTEPAPNEIATAYVRLLDDLGAPLVRDICPEVPGGGTPDWGAVDAWVHALTRADRDLLCVWTEIPAEADLPAFAEKVRRFVERYDGDRRDDMPGLVRPIRAYEFGNGIERVPVDQYAAALRAFSEAVRSADPHATIALGTLHHVGEAGTGSDADTTYFERLLGASALQGPGYPYFQTACFRNFPADHPGRSPFDHALAYLRTTMAARGLMLPIWLTEFGFDRASRSDELQRDMLIRWAVRARALGVERAYVFALDDIEPVGVEGAGRRYGLVAQTATGEIVRRPAFAAVATLVDELRERPAVEKRGEALYALTGTGAATYVLWREEAYDLPAPELFGWWEIRTLTGRRFVRQATEIEVTATPMFLRRTKSPFLGSSSE